ncbi:MAG: flagellar basal body rod protein FlgC [Firmicutes bacterium]|nr:flagellar basal body rod protein FlgC [Bacillota bacterium]
MFNGMDISATALTSESLWMDTIANNLANANTSSSANGTPYRQESVAFSAIAPTAASPAGNGVRVTKIMLSPAPFATVYDPTSPYANAQGNIETSNVNLPEQMVNMTEATQSYQANASAFNADKTMILKALTIGV